MAPETPLPQTERTRLRRAPERGSFDRATIHAILDEGLVCQVAFAVDGQPHMIPTIYARIGDTLFMHGAATGRTPRALAAGLEACVSVTLIDGLVVARSAFHHSMNYRSVVLYGTATQVTDPQQKLEALRALVEHVLPGRWKDVRGPNKTEFKRTSVLALPISEGSAKLRSGPPVDDEADYSLGCWAGVLPLTTTPGPLCDDPRLAPGIEPPPYVAEWARPRSRMEDAS